MGKTRKLQISNRRGQSITSVLIGIALTSAVGLAMMEMAKNLADVHQTAKIREEAQNTSTLAAMFLRNRDFCRESLIGAAPIDLAQITEGRPLKRLKSSKSKEPLFEVGREGLTNIMVEPLKKDRDLASVSATRYAGQVRFEFSKGHAVLGGGVGDKIVPVMFSLAGGKAVDCVAIGEGDPTDDPGGDPHNNKNNCRGQYYPIDGKKLAGQPIENVLRGPKGGLTLAQVNAALKQYHFVGASQLELRAENEKVRETLLKESPPDLMRAPAEENNGGYDFGVSPVVDAATVRIKTINGKKYMVTPTLENGYAESSPTSVTTYSEMTGPEGHFMGISSATSEGPPRMSISCVNGRYYQY